MTTNIIHLKCPEYKFDDSLKLEKISECIDRVLIKNFNGKDIVLRAIQSEKHKLSKDKIVKLILDTGSDRYADESSNQVKFNDIHIDLFGLICKVNGVIALPILEGFHKWKPKCLERPQRRLDIWMIYDADQLKNVEYNHSYYNVKAKDGYVFKKPKSKTEALLGLLVID